MTYHSSYTESVSSTLQEEGIDAFFNNFIPLKKNKSNKCFKEYRRLFAHNNHWSVVEKHSYNEFLKDNLDSFMESHSFKNSQNIYSSMAVYIKSKNYAQCRAHHFKMMNRFGSVIDIITQHHKWFSGVCENNQGLGEFRGIRVAKDDEGQNIVELHKDKNCWKFMDQDCWGYGSQSYETDLSSFYLL